MSLDDRYRWIVDEEAGVVDGTNRPRTVAVGIHGDRVIMDTRGWVSMPAEVAAQVGFYLQTAAATIEQRRS